MAYGITSSSQLIDIVTINNGIQIINDATEKFIESGNLILAACEICDADALAVDKTTMQPQLEADAQYVKSIKDTIDNYTKEIINIAVQIRAEQESELAKYRAAQQASNNN